MPPRTSSNGAKYRLMSPAKLPISRSTCITIPPGLNPTSFLESPVLLSYVKLMQMGAALFRQRWCNNGTHSLNAGLNQLRKIDVDAFQNITLSPFNTSRYKINYCLFSTSSLDSTEVVSEDTELAGGSRKRILDVTPPLGLNITKYAGTTINRHLSSVATWIASELKPNLALEDFLELENHAHDLKMMQNNLMKASVDVITESERVISKVQSSTFVKQDTDKILEAAQKSLDTLADVYMSQLVKQLQKLEGTDFWKLRPYYSTAMQKFVEAATLVYFCKNGVLLKLEKINASLRPLSVLVIKISPEDYLFGIADLTGELMSVALRLIERGEIGFARRIVMLLGKIHSLLRETGENMFEIKNELQSKMKTVSKNISEVDKAFVNFNSRG